MYTYKIWNKQDSINGINAEDILLNNDPSKEYFIVSIFGADNQFNEVENIRAIKGYSSEMTSEEIAKAYTEELNNEIEKNSLHNKISILEEENKKLKEVTKDQDNLLVDNAYKITILEMNLGGK